MTFNNSVANLAQNIKTRLVGASSKSILSRSVLRIYSLYYGAHIFFHEDCIAIRKHGIEMRLSRKHFVCVPAMLQRFDLYSATFVPAQIDGRPVLDFSSPGVHKYKKSGLAFHFPSIPEEGLDEAYIHWYRPQAGETVFDIGAHAGVSTYLLSQAVGSTGTVYAFEPDYTNYEHLLKNIEKHRMMNVVPLRRAISGTTGKLPFTMNGTIGSGLREFLLYPDTGTTVAVDTLTIAGACAETGALPSFIKMDIEGAELNAISGSLDFLASHSVQFALDTNHVVDGQFTFSRVEALFRSIGYEAESSQQYDGLWTTWARPATPILSSRNPLGKVNQ